MESLDANTPTVAPAPEEATTPLPRIASDVSPAEAAELAAAERLGVSVPPRPRLSAAAAQILSIFRGYALAAASSRDRLIATVDPEPTDEGSPQ